MFNTHECKKCGKILPKGYSEPLCENCKTKKAHTFKTAALAVAGTLFTVAGIAVSLVTGGKVNLPTKK